MTVMDDRSRFFFFYRSAVTAEVVPDAEELDKDKNNESPQYVEIVDPFASEISFLKSKCPEKRVIKVVCDNLGKLTICL